MNIHRHLVAAFLIVSVVVASLSAPFILQGNGTSMVWVVEGAVLLWIGVWKQNFLLRVCGLLLQAGGAYVFLDSVFYPFYSTVFLNRYFLSCLFIGSSALYSGYILAEEAESLQLGEKWLVPLLIGLGQLWWYAAGLREIAGHNLEIAGYNAFLLFCCGVAVVMTIAARKLDWPGLGCAQMLFLPLAAACGIVAWLAVSGLSHLFAGEGWVAWLVAVFCQFRMLYHYRGIWPGKMSDWYYAATVWLVAVLACHEIQWLFVDVLGLAPVWGMFSWLLLPAAGAYSCFRRARRTG